MSAQDPKQELRENGGPKETGRSGEDIRSFRELAELPEANPYPVLRCDDSGHILYQNPAARSFAEQTGFPGKKISDFLPPGFSAKVGRLIDENRTVIDEEWRSLGRILSLTYRPIGGVRQIFVFVVDVTQRVEAIQQCQTYAGQLEAINRQLQDTQAELVQSEKMASLGNLVAGIAHEINSPLGAVSGNNQTMALSAARLGRIVKERLPACNDEEAVTLGRLVRLITDLSEANRTAIGRIKKIIDSMRSFARLDQAEEDLFDFNAGIETTLTLLDHELRGKASIHRDFGDIPAVYCKPREINQVFMNLLVNAAQAIQGAGRIGIKTRHRGDVVIIEVSDTGKGIPGESLRNIFDPGFTTRGVRTGIGLGLPIAYRIVRDHGGAITVKSEPGRGSTFTVTLPVRPPK